jgi:RNA polymerase sigma factor (sigma-70 family)
LTASREQLLDELRPAAFAVAYRMLGSVAEAEDVVQETLLRVHRALEAGEELRSARGYAATVATRLAIDELRSARVRRQSYVGQWLPEPLVAAAAGADGDPAAGAELADSLSLAFLLVLERLSPEQRAVFLLHDVFDYGYAEIAAIIDRREDNVRQLAARARRRVADGRPRFDATPEQRDELAGRFFAAARDGDLPALEQLLAADVVLHGDGGGRVPALARSLHGRRRVARTLVAWARAGEKAGGASLERVAVNGQPGALMRDGAGHVLGVMALDLAGGLVRGVSSVVNPDKLGHLGPVTELGAFLAGRAPDA